MPLPLDRAQVRPDLPGPSNGARCQANYAWLFHLLKHPLFRQMPVPSAEVPGPRVGVQETILRANDVDRMLQEDQELLLQQEGVPRK